jgi:23S rRNA (cytidine1920-2'-O)/16S rRNA (cytidine1409-2'-O)-methyltransferase
MASPRTRLDQLLVTRGLAETRARAQALILAGKVRLAGQRLDKAGLAIAEDAELEVEADDGWASRGAHKLLGAIAAFPVFAARIADADCLDVGASTGGFTDVLLRHGAKRVIALDVGYGQLHERLRQDCRVIIMDRTNIRTLPPETLAFRPRIAVCDASFISVRLFLDVVYRELENSGLFLVLVKPQFEVGRDKVGKGGVVWDDGDRQAALDAVVASASAVGFSALGAVESPLRGPSGNREWLLLLEKGGESVVPAT